MNGRAYGETDLGAGVYDDGNDEAPAARPRAKRCPTCPRCGSNDTSSQVHHPNGEWFCSVCSSLHNASEREWHVLAKARKRAIEKRAQLAKEAG